MSLQDRISQEIKTAMLAKDAERLSTLRMLKSTLGYVQIERKTEPCHDKARALQDAQRTRHILQEKLVGEGEEQHHADREQAGGVETQRQFGRHRHTLTGRG